MKRLSVFVVLSILFNYCLAVTYTTGFEDFNKTTYFTTPNTVTTAGLTWTMYNALSGSTASDKKNGVYSMRLRGADGYIQMTQNKINGAGTISFNYANYGTDAGGKFDLMISQDGGATWLTLASAIACTGA